MSVTEYEAAVAACPTPVYHETHRYCPACPWTERGPMTPTEVPEEERVRRNKRIVSIRYDHADVLSLLRDLDRITVERDDWRQRHAEMVKFATEERERPQDLIERITKERDEARAFMSTVVATHEDRMARIEQAIPMNDADATIEALARRAQHLLEGPGEK